MEEPWWGGIFLMFMIYLIISSFTKDLNWLVKGMKRFLLRKKVHMKKRVCDCKNHKERE